MNPKEYHFKLPKRENPSNLQLSELWYPDVKKYWEKSASTRMFNPIYGIRAIVIHATAGYSSDGAMSVMRNGNASWHWLVPDENEPEHGKIIWACAPETLAAHHVRKHVSHPEVNHGKAKVNLWSLGVEIVNRNITSDSYSDWQIRTTANIVKYCWAKYPNLEHVVSHAKLDPSRRTDPGTHFPWNRFKDMVLDSNFEDLIIHSNILKNKKISKEEFDINLENLCC